MDFKNLNKNPLKILFNLLIFLFTNCTFVYKPIPDANAIHKAPITVDSIIQEPNKYSMYNTRGNLFLKEKYYEAMEMARDEYIKVVHIAESLGIMNSAYLDTCCNHINKIDSLLNENSMVKYCDSIKNIKF